MDYKKIAVIEALAEYHGIVTDACRKVGIPRSTYYNWINTDPEFKAAADECQEEALDFVEGKLFQKINGVKIGEYKDGEINVYEQPPSDTAIIFYLKTKGKKRGYIERQEVEQSGGLTIQWQEQKTYEKPVFPADRETKSDL